MNSQYFYYENWQANGHKATIHFGDCSFCNHGKGIHLNSTEEHGKWDGPFQSFAKAYAAANSTGAEVKNCKKCNPV